MSEQKPIECDNIIDLVTQGRKIKCRNEATFYCIDKNLQDLKKNLCFFCYYGNDARGEAQELREKEKRKEKLALVQAISIALLIASIMLFVINLLGHLK